MLAAWEAENPAVVGNIFHSIEHVNLQTVLGYQFRTDTPVVRVGAAEEENDPENTPL